MNTLQFDSCEHHLLWFRPVSPLAYALPSALQSQTWHSVTHLPLDTLTVTSVTATDLQCLQQADAWFLSSPTAAHLAASLSRKLILSGLNLAVVGQPSLDAWQAAGGATPSAVHISITGESMGVFDALRRYNSVALVRGQTGRADLSNALTAVGVLVNPVAVYQKEASNGFAAQLATAHAQAVPLALCFTSTDQPARVLAKSNNKAELLKAPFWALHPRIAAQARALGFVTALN